MKNHQLELVWKTHNEKSYIFISWFLLSLKTDQLDIIVIGFIFYISWGGRGNFFL